MMMMIIIIIISRHKGTNTRLARRPKRNQLLLQHVTRTPQHNDAFHLSILAGQFNHFANRMHQFERQFIFHFLELFQLGVHYSQSDK